VTCVEVTAVSVFLTYLLSVILLPVLISLCLCVQVSVLNTVDTGHEDMIVSLLEPWRMLLKIALIEAPVVLNFKLSSN